MKGLNEDIKTGSFCPVYLLYGEEAYLKNLYKKKLRSAVLPEDDTMNFSLFEGKGIDVKQVIDQAETMPFFADHRLIQIEDSGLFKAASPELSDYLPGMPPETVMVFVETEVDKRGKLFKTVKKCGRAVEMGRQDTRTLTNWVLGIIRRNGKKITQDALSLFLEKAGDDMENLEHELEKLLSYTAQSDAVTRPDVEEICTVTTENRIFDMIRAVAEKQQRKALELYYDLLAFKEPPMRILALTARQYNQMLLASDLRDQGYSGKALAQRAGLAPFVAQRSLSQASHYSKKALQEAVEACVEAEESVKTGRLNDRMAIELLIVAFSQSAV